MSDKSRKKNGKLSAEENELIKFLNDYLEKNGSRFRTKSIILFETDAHASPRMSSYTKSETGSNDAEAFKGLTGLDSNLALVMSVCNPLTKPRNCENGAVCVVNHGSAPYWECLD